MTWDSWRNGHLSRLRYLVENNFGEQKKKKGGEGGQGEKEGKIIDGGTGG
jgi:hypothetical protein